jgi:hypothetical protein
MHSTGFLQIAMTAMFVSIFGFGEVQSQAPGPKPCADPEYRQFDFWIGEWTVEQPDGKVAGSNRIERVAGDCGLQETWTSATGGSGRSLNTYSPQDGKWHQVWLGSGGLWMHLTGSLRDRSMVLEGQTVGREKEVIRQRVTWTPQADGRVRQLWEQSKDDGKTWTVAFDGMYSKKKKG